VERLMSSGAERSLADDESFKKARARFADEPIFGYVEIGAPLRSLMAGESGAASAAYTAGALTALSSLPSAIVFGGSIHGESASVRALMIQDLKKPGVLSWLLTGTRAAQPMAAAYAAPDSDLFVSLMVDWERLFDGIGSALAAGSQGATNEAGTGAVDLLAAADAAFGFSVRNDLIPAMGNEVAFSISGLNGVLRPAAAGAGGASPKPRFALMIAVRDAARFEALVGKLISKLGPKSAQGFLRSSYRGAAISYRHDIAYTVSGGFFILASGRAAVQQALDWHAAGTSLGSSEPFLAAVGAPRPATLQAYLSPNVSRELLNSIVGRGDKTSPETGTPAASGLVITPDPEGFMLEIRLPSRLALAALGSLMTSDGRPYGVTSPQSAGSPRSNGRRSPTLTTEDLRRP
ncbi:MAG TPA: DUF3352 domain-containing protein, partial [Blastocatellia bacterium]|nr:DUF3352 domain-containing protein [Blastocatellia bacterium]